MKRSIYIITCTIFMVCACSSPLNLVDINNLNKLEFVPLSISSECELFDLRIDVIRQTYEEQVNDSTSETRKVPYHKLGFDLGNGLFYDLNDNLSIRIDYLLDIDPENDFKIEKNYGRKRWHRIYSYSDGDFNIQYQNRNKVNTMLKIDQFNDSLSLTYRNKYKYAIVKTDTSLAYLNRRKNINKIQKKAKNYYYQSLRRRNAEYRYMDNEIILNNKYKVLLTPDGKHIEIKRIWRNSDVLLYEIIKDENTIFIYNKKYYGKKIELDNSGFTLYYNDTFGYQILISPTSP